MGSFSLAARRILLAGAATGVAMGMAPASNAASTAAQAYDLSSQSLEDALRAVAVRSGRAILAPSALLAGKRAAPLKGSYTPVEAFRALLAGSGLQMSLVGDTVIVRDPRDPPQPGSNDPAVPTVEEIQVTGTRIRGAQPAAPVHTITRTDVDQSGYSQVGDLVRSLPENFSGGQNPGVLSGAANTNVGNQNTTNASSINLRGLGSDATLVLLDGHRLAADGGFQAPDVSAIPLAAIERIEIVTDGASALYGSDAVAGVANFILRKDYDGGELSERLGGATQGGGFEQTYNALGGKTWSSGHALASVEYSHQDQITTGERDFTAGAAPINALLQAQTRTSLFANAGQDLTPWASFHMDALYSQRNTGDLEQVPVGGAVYTSAIAVQSYMAAPGVTLKLPGSWTATVDGTVSGTMDYTNILYAGGSISDRFRNASESLEASANGEAFSLPSGALKLAIGGGYREEAFEYRDSGPSLYDGSRGVAYLFGEAFAPLVRPSEDRLGLNALDLTVAGRVERYSDFGFTANPKVGLRYKPMPGVTLRATWGTSFKAPQFIQKVESPTIFYYPAASLGGTGAGTGLLTYGGNPDLRPERSASWTVGVDWSPPQIRALTVSLTYFNIDYTDRIVQPVTNVGAALSDPIYAPFVTANPTPAQQAAAIAGSTTFFNYVGAPYDSSQVTALIQDRYVNASAQTIDGVDLSIKKSFSLPLGALDAVANVSWLHIVQQTIATAPSQTLTGTLFNPPTVRLRSGLTWTYGGFSSTGIVNYIAGETDTGVTPNVPVGSWTTVDVNLAYRIGRVIPRLPGLEASLSITNAFDRAPPFAKGAGVEFPGVYFDSTNTSAIGRFVALTFRQSF